MGYSLSEIKRPEGPCPLRWSRAKGTCSLRLGWGIRYQKLNAQRDHAPFDGVEPKLNAQRDHAPFDGVEPVMVEGEGFEPSKAEPSDLQSDPFDRSGTPPGNEETKALND
jgi:hypothetical protein